MSIIQVVRHFTVTGNGWKTLQGDTPRRMQLGGQVDGWWANRWHTAAPSEGWRVDTRDDSTSPWYTKEGNHLDDSPHFFDTIKPNGGYEGEGMEFYTCAIGFSGGKGEFLGCLHWAFYRDPSGSVSWVWDEKGIASLECPVEIGDAINRWNSITENEVTKIWYGLRQTPDKPSERLPVDPATAYRM
jgi:hypothetical protein